MKKPSRSVSLSVDQLEVAAQFADYSFENPDLTCDQVARKMLGARPFPNTPVRRKFKREAKETFDQERQK